MNKLKLLSVVVSAMTLSLYGLVGTTPAQATANIGIYELDDGQCLADAFVEVYPKASLPHDYINCTAQDVEITQVTPLDPNAECTPGYTFEFQADVTVKTNASERYDPTFYLPLDENFPLPQYIQNDGNNCFLIVGDPASESNYVLDAFENLDFDGCQDITKANGTDEYVLKGVWLKMLCKESDLDPTRADFTYCAAWSIEDEANCDISFTPRGQVPTNKAKCGCDSYPINIYIKPPAPVISKTLKSTNTLSEPGGIYNFSMEFSNPSANASMYITGLTDEIDITGDSYYDVSLDLWGSIESPPYPATDGVYLVDSTCVQPLSSGEILPGNLYGCTFSVLIVDSDLPNDQNPEFYDDVVKVVLEDKNSDPVVNGETCPDDLAAVAGEHCSEVIQVEVTNLPPTISVTKTADPIEVLEPGDDVFFTITVENTSDSWDDPLTITYLNDSIYGDLFAKGGCVDADGWPLYSGVSNIYSCSFTEYVGGNQGETHTNTVTGKAVDNEADEASHSDSASVDISDVPSSIELLKTADPIEVFETGDSSEKRDVDYRFRFRVKTEVGEPPLPTVDNVIFYKLEDLVLTTTTDITGDCMVDNDNGASITPTPLVGFELAPGEYASCVVSMKLTGNADDVHTNTATIYGTDDDGLEVQASDPADVTFLDSKLDITPEFAMKATAFVRLTNGGVDDVNITVMTLMGTALVAGGGIPGLFDILDESASSSYQSGVDPYDFCQLTTIATGTTYECSFTLKLYPGFIPADGDINLIAEGANGLVFTLDDNDGSALVTSTIAIGIQTRE